MPFCQFGRRGKMSTQAVTIHGVITPPKHADDHWHIVGDITFDPTLPTRGIHKQDLCISGYVIAIPPSPDELIPDDDTNDHDANGDQDAH